MIKCQVISAAKANRLYWLGRYVERCYISLHLLRRYYDKMIDSPHEVYEEFYRKLDTINPYPNAKSFQKGSLYDKQNPISIISGLEACNDNGIVLRREISTETLSYIEMSLSRIKEASAEEELNITHLQSITDNLLAFWGSIDVRVFDERIRSFLRLGRLVENIDMHIRFDYQYYRIEEAFESLIMRIERDSSAVDVTVLEQLKQLITQSQYENSTPEYKYKVLKYLNHLVIL